MKKTNLATDPTLLEIRAIKEEIAAENDYDLQKRFQALKAAEATHPERVVSREKPGRSKQKSSVRG